MTQASSTPSPTNRQIVAAAQQVPETRDLSVLLAALEIVESEFAFQAYRMREHAQPKTEDDRKYFADLERKYTEGQKITKKLRKYTASRHRRILAGEEMPAPLHDERAIDAAGRATAYIDDEDAPV